MKKIREEFEVENDGIVIPTEVRWQANTCTIRGMRQNGEIARSSVVSIITVSTVAQSLVKKGIKAVGLCYQVETYMNEGHDSRRKLRCGRGDIVNKCGRMQKCGYCSGHHWTSDHKCSVVGCTAKQGSLCGHMLEKCPNCKANHITITIRCGKKRDTTEAA
jgi:hypothetical protein